MWSSARCRSRAISSRRHLGGGRRIATLVPLDEDAILNSVAKTSRLVIVHEAVKRGGFGAENRGAGQREGARPARRAHRAPGSAQTCPMPYNDKLELATIPSRDDITAAIRSVL